MCTPLNGTLGGRAHIVASLRAFAVIHRLSWHPLIRMSAEVGVLPTYAHQQEACSMQQFLSSVGGLSSDWSVVSVAQPTPLTEKIDNYQALSPRPTLLRRHVRAVHSHSRGQSGHG